MEERLFVGSASESLDVAYAVQRRTGSLTSSASRHIARGWTLLFQIDNAILVQSYVCHVVPIGLY